MLQVSPWKAGTIASGGTVSTEVDLEGYYSGLLVVVPPLTQASLTLSVSDTDIAGGGYTVLDKPDGGGAMTLAPSKAHALSVNGTRFLKFTAPGAEAAERVIKVRGMV